MTDPVAAWADFARAACHALPASGQHSLRLAPVLMVVRPSSPRTAPLLRPLRRLS
jgi:hypothetical protein